MFIEILAINKGCLSGRGIALSILCIHQIKKQMIISIWPKYLSITDVLKAFSVKLKHCNSIEQSVRNQAASFN